MSRPRTKCESNATAVLAGVMLACASPSLNIAADPLHPRSNGDYWHHDSNWIFPERIGDFVRVGVPQDIAGSRDASAYYARVADGVRTVASVDVYPFDSAVGETTFANAKASLEAELATSQPQLQSGGSFGISAGRDLQGMMVSYRTSQQGKPTLTNLYFADLGDWHVKIKITAPGADTDTSQTLGEFARDQRWDTLIATNDT